MSRELNSAQLKLMRLFERKVPCVLIGSPGVGKSAIAREVADEAGVAFIDKRLSIVESVDLRGNPVADRETKTTQWYMPDDMPFVGSKFPDRGILCLEEINACNPSVQVAAYQLADIKSKGIGEHKIMPGWYVMATGNRVTDGAGAQRMNSALANRFAWLDVEVELEPWAQWALAHGVSPDLVGYLLWRGVDSLFKMPKDAREFPSPRSWTNASVFMDLPMSERKGLIASCVGHGEAADLEAFLMIKNDLEPIPFILANPLTAKVPELTNIGALFAVTMAVAAAIDKRSAKAGATYATRLPAEFKALFAKSVLLRDRQLAAYGFSALAAGSSI